MNQVNRYNLYFDMLDFNGSDPYIIYNKNKFWG